MSELLQYGFSIMWQGMLGIFVMTVLIMAVVKLLAVTTKSKE